MSEFFHRLFDTDFMPHAMCLRTPGVIWLHVVSDGLLALAYLLIPMGLLRLLRLRKDLAFHWMFVLFAGFILSCGATHILAIITLWTPVYRLEGLVKAATALGSLATGFFLISLVPRIAGLPSLEQWRAANVELESKVAELKQAHANAALGFSIVSKRARQQELIAKLGTFALDGAAQDKLFAEAASAIAKGFGEDYGRIMQFEAGGRAFIQRAAVGFDCGLIGPAPSGDMRMEETLASRKPRIVSDFATEGNTAACAFLSEHGIASGMELAIVCEGGPWGIVAAYSNERDKFSAENVDFLQSIANILANSIDRMYWETQLVQLAKYDPLTGLANRSMVNDCLAAALAQAGKTCRLPAVLYLDLDRFKHVNDAFGHSFGDRLLQEVGRRLQVSVRASGTVSRLGGDEFLVVLPEADSKEEAARLAERVILSIAEPISIDGVELTVKASVGIACFPEHGGSAEALMRNADAAMYTAKDSRLGSYRFYSEDMTARTLGRVLLQADLNHTMERNELFLQYQPQVAMGGAPVTGVEALVRWRHPTLGVIPPRRFIAAAEESGHIVSIGMWVLEAVCLQQAQWVRDGIARGRMAVNVSALQFAQPSFLDTVVEILERTRLDPRYLELEVTESVVMHGIDGVFGKLASLDKLGVILTIDEFGTGPCNLSYLKQVPVGRLKIDRSFIKGLPKDPKNGALSQAIVRMGHALGMNVIAEGVETQEQADYLQSISCDGAQGFLYSIPLSSADCADFLRNEKSRTDFTRIPERSASPL